MYITVFYDTIICLMFQSVVKFYGIKYRSLKKYNAGLNTGIV